MVHRAWQPLQTLPAAMVVIGLLILWFIIRHPLDISRLWVNVLSCALLAPLPLVLFLLLRPRILRHALDIESAAAFPLIDPQRLCIIRHTGDEALTGLSGAAFFSWITTTIIGWADSVAAAFVRYLAPAVSSQKRFEVWLRSVGALLVSSFAFILVGDRISPYSSYDADSMSWRQWISFGFGAIAGVTLLLACAAMVVALLVYLGKEDVLRKTMQFLRLMAISITVIAAMPLLAILALPFGPEGLLLGLRETDAKTPAHRGRETSNRTP
jgi:hypothetical protein